MKYLSNKFEIIIPPNDIACDAGCLQRLADGDQKAYTWVYKNYCKKVYDYALLITKNATLSEDIVQQVFLNLWNNRERLRTVNMFNGYLYMLYHNYILDILKKEEVEKNTRVKYCFHIQQASTITQETIAYNEARRQTGRGNRCE